MRRNSRNISLVLGLAAIVATAACSKPTGTLAAAADTLKANDTKSIEFSGTGKWFQFGQAPNATLPWPQFDVAAFTASINYETPAARVQMTRKQTVDPARVRPTPVDQSPTSTSAARSPGTWRLQPVRPPARLRRPPRNRRPSKSA